MSALQISRAGLAAIVARLSDTSTGFLPLYNAAIADAGIDVPDEWAWPIDFSTGSTNFFQANLTPDLIEEGESMTLPLMTAFTRGSRNANLEKFYTFSGPVQFGINFFATWEAPNPYALIESLRAAYEEALFGCFNAPAVAIWAQLANQQLVYNGDLQIEPGPIAMGGKSLLQIYYGVLGLDVHAL